MTTRSTGFWSEGHRKHVDALREEEEQKVAPLRQALESEPNAEIKDKLKDQIKAIQAEFEKKRKAADSSLFMKA